MALATNSTPGTIHLDGDLRGGKDPLQINLTPTGVKKGNYVPCNLVVDSKGRALVAYQPTPSYLTTFIGDATTLVKGVVSISDGINVAAGTIAANMVYISANVTPAENATLGIVKSANTTHITFSSGSMNVGSNVGLKDTATTWLTTQTETKDNITYSASVTPNLSLSTIFELSLTGNVTVNSPTNAVVGGTYYFIIKQDNTGGRIVTWTTQFDFGVGDDTLSTTADAIDVLIITNISTGNYICSLTKDYQ